MRRKGGGGKYIKNSTNYNRKKSKLRHTFGIILI